MKIRMILNGQIGLTLTTAIVSTLILHLLSFQPSQETIELDKEPGLVKLTFLRNKVMRNAISFLKMDQREK